MEKHWWIPGRGQKSCQRKALLYPSLLIIALSYKYMNTYTKYKEIHELLCSITSISVHRLFKSDKYKSNCSKCLVITFNSKKIDK